MPIAVLRRDDPRPELTPLPGLSVERELDAHTMAELQGRAVDDIVGRFEAGHRAYVAKMHGVPAAWGWVATESAEIGEVRAAFTVPRNSRYLWNFVTVSTHRGLGIYPRLLSEIVRIESREAEWFWIVYAPENHASGSGIRKVGFVTLAELSFDRAGQPALRSLLPGGAEAASRVLGLTKTDETLTPCWRCVRAGRGPMTCPEDACQCDYQHPERACELNAASPPPLSLTA
jgi:hypothetical protein